MSKDLAALIASKPKRIAGVSNAELAKFWPELHRAGYQGEIRDLLDVELCKHLVKDYPRQIYSGAVFRRVSKLGRGLERPSWMTREDAVELMSEVYLDVGTKFWDRCERGTGWDPSSGRTIVEEYIGFLDLNFNNAYRRWEGNRFRIGQLTGEIDPLQRICVKDLMSSLDATATVDGMFPKERGMCRRILLAFALGMSPADIRKEFGMKPKQLPKFMRQIRQRYQDPGGAK